MKKIIIIILLLSTVVGFSQKIRLSGSWTKTLKSSNITSAGDDYEQFYLSGTKQTRITITPIPNSKYNRENMAFKVFVNKEDVEWHSDLVIEAKLTSTNHGNYSGTSFQAITNNSSFFFSTIGKQKNLPIQYKISGLSVTIPAEIYSTEIIYTVLNL